MKVNFHDHLDFYRDLNQAIDLINESEILTLACTKNLEEYRDLRKKLGENTLIKLGLGIHPFVVNKDTSFDGLDEYIKDCDFVGEIGIDFYWAQEKEYYPKQVEIFKSFIESAKKYDKVTNIHTKGAEKVILEILKEYRPRSPIIHWYSGDLNLIEKYLDLGSYFTISVDAGYSELTDKMIDILPLDRILTETDGPTSLAWVMEDLSLSERRLGNPEYIDFILSYIARRKNIKKEKVEEQVYKNYLQIFE